MKMRHWRNGPPLEFLSVDVVNIVVLPIPWLEINRHVL